MSNVIGFFSVKHLGVDSAEPAQLLRKSRFYRVTDRRDPEGRESRRRTERADEEARDHPHFGASSWAETVPSGDALPTRA